MGRYYFLLTTFVLIYSCYIKEIFSSSAVCYKQEKSSIYLDLATDMINKAKEEQACCKKAISNPVDCEEVQKKGHSKSGLYTIWPMSRIMEDKSLEVYCDMETEGGGWTVIQRRGNFVSPKELFYKDWSSYKNGFGDLEKDFWLGNDNIFALTNQRLYSVRFDLVAVDGERRYANYGKFWIDDEANNYTLHIRGYNGDAGDSMVYAHNNRQFSTKDRDNDLNHFHCAEKFKGGWWYGPCHHANLNGLYHRGYHSSYADGVNWLTFRNFHESLESTEIKIRPQNLKEKTMEIQNPFSNFELPKVNESLKELF